MDPMTVALLAKGGGTLFNFLGGRKKGKEQDRVAAANAAAQAAETNALNAWETENFNADAEYQQANRNARRSMGQSLLGSLAPETIAPDALARILAASRSAPTKAVTRKAPPVVSARLAPSSTTGMGYSLLAGGANALAESQIGKQRAADFESAEDRRHRRLRELLYGKEKKDLFAPVDDREWI